MDSYLQFLVRMRDNELKTIPGVTIEDMGYKMGLNGVDNAKLSFDNVRVPREALLNRWSDVAEARRLLTPLMLYLIKQYLQYRTVPYCHGGMVPDT